MSDFIFVGATVVFFAICALYVKWCDRIIGPDEFPTADDVETPTEDGLPVLAAASVGADSEVRP